MRIAIGAMGKSKSLFRHFLCVTVLPDGDTYHQQQKTGPDNEKERFFCLLPPQEHRSPQIRLRTPPLDISQSLWALPTIY